jgi:hypothetical protein
LKKSTFERPFRFFAVWIFAHNFPQFAFDLLKMSDKNVPFMFGKRPMDNAPAVVDTVDDILNADDGSVLENMQNAVFGKNDGSKFLISKSYLENIHPLGTSNSFVDILGEEIDGADGHHWCEPYIVVNRIEKLGLLDETFKVVCESALLAMKDSTLYKAKFPSSLVESKPIPICVIDRPVDEPDHKECTICVEEHWQFVPSTGTLLLCVSTFHVTFKRDVASGSFVFAVLFKDIATIGEMRKDGTEL